MTELWSAWPRHGALLLAFALGATLAGPLSSLWRGRWPRLGDYRSSLRRDLAFIRSDFVAAQVIGAQGGATLAVMLGAVAAAHPWPLSLLPLVWLGPGMWTDRRVTARRREIEEQLDDWLISLANSLHATPSLGAALETSIAGARGPIAQEVDGALKQHRLGTPLREALDAMGARVDSRALSGAVLILQLALRMGGNLPATLKSTAATLREIARLEGVLRTRTAEGRGQTRLIAMLPLPLLTSVHLVDPGFFAPLASSDKGRLVVAGAAALWLVAVVCARRIVQVEV